MVLRTLSCTCLCHRDEYSLRPATSASVSKASSEEMLLGRLDREISLARAHMNSLARRRNDLVPVSRLLPEVLARIFVGLRKESGPFGRRWIAEVAHVCQKWRAVAMATAALWAAADYDSDAEVADEFVARAKGYPLSLRLSSIPSDPAPVRQARRLDISTSSPSPGELVNRMLLNAGSGLHSLNIRSSSQADVGADIPAALDDLRVLDVKGLPVSWGPVFGTNLTVLRIHGGEFPSCSQLRDALCGLPKLRILSFTDALPSEPTWESGNDDPINLPSLEVLEVADALPSLIPLVQRLTISEEPQIILRDTRMSDLASVRQLLASIFTHFFPPKQFPAWDISMEFRDDDLVIVGWGKESAANRPCALHLDLYPTTDTTSFAFAALADSALAPRIRTLRLYSDSEMDDGRSWPGWSECRLPELRTLYAGGFSAHDLLFTINPLGSPNLANLDLSCGAMGQGDLDALERTLDGWQADGLHIATLYLREHSDIRASAAGKIVHLPPGGETLWKRDRTSVTDMVTAILEDDMF